MLVSPTVKVTAGSPFACFKKVNESKHTHCSTPSILPQRTVLKPSMEWHISITKWLHFLTEQQGKGREAGQTGRCPPFPLTAQAPHKNKQHQTQTLRSCVSVPICHSLCGPFCYVSDASQASSCNFPFSLDFLLNLGNVSGLSQASLGTDKTFFFLSFSLESEQERAIQLILLAS